MKWSDFIIEMQDLHFRKMLFLICFAAAAVLLVLKYWLLPLIHRRLYVVYRLLKWIIDFLILLTFSVIAIAASGFWLSGNNHRGGL
ncbi:MAG: hypothetical protein JKY70_15535 [Mucilaginibacter sp.]|nr:hypothetical protein [Mucilaginibacter sp.]